jgi:5-methyltetrahydropteroyltriglutamate--homocysteine methyltransferase
MMNHTKPLDGVRVDFVGSFLRPQRLKDAFAGYLSGEISSEALRSAQDAAIRELVREQERHGLPLVNDGEYRRRYFMESLSGIGGLEPWHDGWTQLLADLEEPEDHVRPETRGLETGNERRKPVTRRLSLDRNVVLDEYNFASGVATKPVKVTLVGPDRFTQRFAYEESRNVYPTIDAFVYDAVNVERRIVSELRDAGCRYVQIDAPGYTAYVDEAMLTAMRSRGEDPRRNMERSIAADKALAADFPEMTFGVHLCRGNHQSNWHREGSYDAIAERLFNELPYERLLLEYDDARSGGFEPLRFVPRGKIVVLGLISTKTARVETVDELRRRLDEASQYVDLRQVALSPQCGFATTLTGNLLTQDDQWHKIEVMMKTARAVWG